MQHAFNRSSNRVSGTRRGKTLLLESLEHRRVLATISGHVIDDVNGNGVIDDGEPPIAAIDVFDDLNGNGVLDRNGTYIEPDHFETNEIIGLVSDNVVLSVANQDNEIIPEFAPVRVKESVFASTGNKVFGYADDKQDVNFFHNTRRLRIDFTEVVSSIAIDFVGTRPRAPEVGRLEVFAADGTLLATDQTDELKNGEFDTMMVSTAPPAIAYAIAYTAPTGLNGHLDNLRINSAGSEPWTTTASDGSYSLEVSAGTHPIDVVLKDGWTKSSPTGPNEQTVGADETVENVDFGLQTNRIRGRVFDDVGVTGVYEPGVDQVLAGATVYLDTNGNSQLDRPTTQIEPDNFSEGAVLDRVANGVTLSAADLINTPRQHVYASTDVLSSTGTLVFGRPGSTSWGTANRFRADFDHPVTSVSIDFISSADNERAVLIAYNANDEQVGIVGADATPVGESNTLTVTTGGRDIDYVIAYSIPEPGRGFGRLDNLVVEGIPAEPTFQTDDDGVYLIEPLADGDYTVRMELPEGKTNSLPAAGKYDVSLISGALVADRDFGVVDAIIDSWQNPSNRLDVDGDGFVVPRDVLLIINEINDPVYRDVSTGLLPAPPQSLPNPASRAYFFDVNDDGFVTAFDAIEIINFLNSQVRAEPAARPLDGQTIENAAVMSDDVRAAILSDIADEDDALFGRRR